jgi:hypothetical protein
VNLAPPPPGAWPASLHRAVYVCAALGFHGVSLGSERAFACAVLPAMPVVPPANDHQFAHSAA